MSSSDEDVGDASDGEKLTTQSMDKYRAAAKALNETFGMVVAACTPGARVLDICRLGDSTITKNLQGVFKNGCKKGVAFPTCLSINKNVCHVCPLTSDDTELKEKDIVRIEMACHIDGYITSLVHTLFVTAVPLTGRVAGRAADVIYAVQKAAEILSDVIWPGTTTQEFLEIIQGVAGCFNCKVLSTSGYRLLKKYEAKDSSFSTPTPDEGKFLRDRAYTVDIAFATEHEELELSDETNTTIYRSMVDADYALPDESLAPVFSEIMQKFSKLPFCVRSLVNFARTEISACTQYGMLQPYHIGHLKSGFFAHMRFTLLARPIKTSRITEAPQQMLYPMVPVEVHGDIDKLWAKHKGRGEAQTKLFYCGRLPVGEESCGSKPHISDVSWNKVARHWEGASDALACSGSFGTHVYLRSKSITKEPNENIEDGWKKVVIQDTPAKFCKWSPDGIYLAVGLVTDSDIHAGRPEVHVFHWDAVATNIISRRIYVGNENYCFSLNPISWSHNSRCLIAPSRRTHHIPILKVEKSQIFAHTVRFSRNNERFDYLCAAFHPQLLLFIAASTTGRLKLYEVDPVRSNRKPINNKADIWIEDGKEWDDDNYGTRDLSFSTRSGDRLACARSDWSVKIWEFKHDPNGRNTSLSPLFIIDNAGLEDLSVKWTRAYVDILAVGDGQQVISIYGRDNAQKMCGNDHSADLSAHFEKATRTEWHPKQFVLASGGQDGFILFWCLQIHPFKVILDPKQRNVFVEDMYYTHKSLPHGAATIALRRFEETQATMLNFLKNVVAESDVKDKQLAEIAVFANSGLSKINAGGSSVDELADYFKEIVRLSTKTPR